MVDVTSGTFKWIEGGGGDEDDDDDAVGGDGSGVAGGDGASGMRDRKSVV